MASSNAGLETTPLILEDNECGVSTRRSFLRNAFILTTGSWTLSKLGAGNAFSQTVYPAEKGGIAKPILYLVATAHNDSQWNWTVQNTIRDYIPSTMRPNWELMKKYPSYNFNYEATIHYGWFKEYHPEDWKELQDWVAKGRWKLSGGWVNAVDVVIPSPESLFRQALYGQAFFRREFGKVPRDVYLPDCFGFPYSLPTIARHSGLTSFSSQKFDLWGGFRPAPFSVGRWEGVDGSQIVASLRCKAYDTRITSDVSSDPKWTQDFADAGGRQINMRYFGTGDRGGTPGETSISWMQKAIDNPNGVARVVCTSADQLEKDLTPVQIAALPVYKDELLLTDHGAGCLTSQAAMKKWNRANEMLGDAAERAALIANWMGAAPYPKQVLNEAWLRFLWHQFHDDLTGTCIPQAYTFSWNDELLSLNQFAGVITAGIAGLTLSLDTRVQGVPLAVYNPLDQARQECLEATLTLANYAPFVRVFDSETGAEVSSQLLSKTGKRMEFAFLASAPSVGVRIYDVRSSDKPCSLKSDLSVSPGRLENARLRVQLKTNGEIESLFDKAANLQLLGEAATFPYFHDVSTGTPAWEVKWDVIGKPPVGNMNENVHISVLENGPVRVALEVRRTLGETVWIQHLRLTQGGDWVEVDNRVDWRSPGVLVKAAFPLTVSNPNATFDMGLGTIERPNANSKRHEVPAQNWADLSDAGGSGGLAILTRTKYGFDKPNDSTLRLTLLRSPDTNTNYQYQETNDIGRHRFAYALAPHAGDWRKGEVQARAARFNQQMQTFSVPSHSGRGRSFSMLSVSTHQVTVKAFKMAEESEEWVIRLQEQQGQTASAVRIRFAAPLLGAREVNAAEEVVGPYRVQGGELIVDFKPYQPRSFAIRIGRAPRRVAAPVSSSVKLPFDLNGVSTHANLHEVDFSGSGDSFAAELWPTQLERDGLRFELGAPNAPNFVICRGQTITLPRGNFTRAVLLATSINGDQSGEFKIQARGGTQGQSVRVADWTQHIGQWDSRLANPSQGSGGGQIVKDVVDGKVQNLESLHPAYLKPDRVAYVGTHRHFSGGDQIYLFSYLFQIGLDLPSGATQLTLPNNPNIRVAALTVARGTLDDVSPAGAFYEPELVGSVVPKVLPRPAANTRVFGPTAVQSFDGKSGIARNGPELLALPTLASEPWTVNFFVYLDKEPEDHTLMAGFGDARDQTGAQRYLGRVRGGIEFWGSNVNIDSGLPFDIRRWQMVTAVFDGKNVTVYKNGTAAVTVAAALSDAAPEVKMAPNGTWARENRFEGRISGFSIWNSALSGVQVRDLMKEMPQ